jgi:hypothetical protein
MSDATDDATTIIINDGRYAVINVFLLVELTSK